MYDKNEKILKILSKLAEATNYGTIRSKHAAAIVYSGSIISFGLNQRKSHPFHYQFRNNSFSYYWHAETNSIFNALKILKEEKLKKSKLFIVRIKYNNNGDILFGMSKPCSGCVAAIERFQLSEVIYTLDINGYARL